MSGVVYAVLLTVRILLPDDSEPHRTMIPQRDINSCLLRSMEVLDVAADAIKAGASVATTCSVMVPKTHNP